MTSQPEHFEQESALLAPAQQRRALSPAFFYVIVGLIFASDQISKLWIQHTLVWEESRPLIGNAFVLTLTQNTGGAWGVLPKSNGVFIIFAAVAVLALLYAYHRMPRLDLLVGAAFAFALGGALGNLLDRLRYGYVVDFFDVRIIHWPIFNIADSAITVGIVLLLLHFIRPGASEDEPAGENMAPSVPSGAPVSLATEDAGSHSGFPHPSASGREGREEPGLPPRAGGG